jgi:hypothetical protein
MSAVYVSNLTINAGADFAQSFQLGSGDSDAPLDLTGYTAYAQMRKHAGSLNPVTFTTIVSSPSTLGKIVIALSSDQTSQLKPGRYLYDIIIERLDVKTRVVEGMVLVREGVTRI